MRQLKISKNNFKTGNSDQFQRYINDISKSKYDTISADTELAYFKKYKAGDKSYFDLIVNANTKFVISVAKQYNFGDNLMDLINVGNIGLLKAIENFDHTKGFKLISYAVWEIRRHIITYIDNSDIIRIPQNKKKGLKIINSIKAQLTQSKQREPYRYEIEEDFIKTDFAIYYNITSLADYIDMTSTTSYDKPINEDGLTILDTVGTSESTQFYTESLRIELSEMMKSMTFREKYIIEHRFGLNNNPKISIEQISVLMGLSVSTVKNIYNKALRRFRHINRKNDVLTDYL